MTKNVINRITTKHNLYKYANVVAFSETLQMKITKGVVTDQECIKIYVTDKVDITSLNERDIIPSEIDGICTDVVVIGEIKALRLNNHRPIMAGISIGNKAITAGTPTWMFKKGSREYLGSNAHVFVDDPSKSTSIEKRILQRGSHDGGKVPDEIIGEYVWHDQIYPVGDVESECVVGRGILSILNAGYSVFGRRTRFRSYVPHVNYQDFALARLNDGIEFDLRTFDFDVIDEYDYTGIVYAGSPSVSILCKAEYQLATGYTPIGVDVTTLEVGDVVRKSGRTSGDTEGTVVDAAASVKVNYGDFFAVVSDSILCTKFVDGGDSGSSAWKQIEV